MRRQQVIDRWSVIDEQPIERHQIYFQENRDKKLVFKLLKVKVKNTNI